MHAKISVIIGLVVIVGIAFFVIKGREAALDVETPVIQDGTTVITAAEALTALPGRWQSTDDEKAGIVFSTDGTTQGFYNGEELSSGTWELYEDHTASFNPTGTFLRTSINGEVYEYAILNADENQLTLSYLARGNTLNYIRTAE